MHDDALCRNDLGLSMMHEACLLDSEGDMLPKLARPAPTKQTDVFMKEILHTLNIPADISCCIYSRDSHHVINSCCASKREESIIEGADSGR